MTYFGIDVAKWQGTIDWAKVKKDDVKFAILKVTQKNNAVEGAFERNYSGCTAQGIPAGVYRYVYAKTTAAATAEAKAVVTALKGKKIPCGVWLDMEDASIRKLGKAALTAIITAERKVLEAAGHWVGVYCNQNWYDTVLDVDQLKLPFWIAKYGANNGKQNAKPALQSQHTLWGWQYTSVGKVSGIPGSVDLNVEYQAPGAVPTAGTPSRYPKIGAKGDIVKTMQKRLTICGWTLTADGIWGAKTDTAVRGYQHKAGLTVDGIYGPKTERKLVQDAVVARAQELANYLVRHKWRYKGDGYTAKSTFAATKALDKPGCSCAHFVSWVLQDVGLLTAGKILSHSKAGYGTGAKSIVNADQLIDCTVTYPDERIGAYQANLQPGDVLVHDSSIGVWIGSGKLMTAREGQPINDKNVYTDLVVTSGYEWKRDILALVRAK